MAAAAAAAAKSLQSCPTLCDPIDGSPLGSSVPQILQARTLERVAMSFSNSMNGSILLFSFLFFGLFWFLFFCLFALFIFSFFGHVACGISWPRIELKPPLLEVWSLNH